MNKTQRALIIILYSALFITGSVAVIYLIVTQSNPTPQKEALLPFNYDQYYHKIDSIYKVSGRELLHNQLPITHIEQFASGYAKLYLRFALKIFFIFFSLFGALAFWAIAEYANKNYSEKNPEPFDKDLAQSSRAYRWLTVSMALWAISNFMALLAMIFQFEQDIYYRAADSCISTLNSLAIMLALTYMDIDFNTGHKLYLKREWKKIKKNGKKARFYIIAFAIVIMLLDIVLLNLFRESKQIEFILDLILSTVTCLMLGTGMYNVFLLRGLPEVSWLSAGTALLIWLAQLLGRLELYTAKTTVLLYSIQSISSLLFTTFLVTLLFALVLSWFGWKKSMVLEGLISKLEQESKLNNEFINLVARNLPKGAVRKEHLEYLLVYLKTQGIYDYAFGVGIGDMKNKRIIFPFYFEDETAVSDKTISIENTFGGFCLRKGEEVIMPDALDLEQAQKYNVSAIGKKTAPEAKSLIYLPLMKNGECIGVLTIQSREQNRHYTSEMLATLNAMAYLLGQLIDPDQLDYKSTRSFTDGIAYGGDRDLHAAPGKPLSKKLHFKEPGRPEKFRHLDTYLGLEAKETDAYFMLQMPDGFYYDDHPVVRTLKGIAGRNCSRGAILLLAAAAFRSMHQGKKETNDPIAGAWKKIAEKWLQERSLSEYGNRYEIIFRNESDPFDKIDFEEKMETLYEFFKGLSVKKSDPASCNLLDVTIDTKGRVNLVYGIEEMHKLKKNLEEALRNYGKVPQAQLSHDVASGLIIFERNLFFKRFSYDLGENRITLKFD